MEIVQIIITLVLGAFIALISLMWLGGMFFAFAKVMQAVPSVYRALMAVRWPYVVFHATLGSIVSICVAPNLPPYLTMAAGIVSAVLTAAMYKGVQGFITPVPAVPAPKRVRVTTTG